MYLFPQVPEELLKQGFEGLLAKKKVRAKLDLVFFAKQKWYVLHLLNIFSQSRVASLIFVGRGMRQFGIKAKFANCFEYVLQKDCFCQIGKFCNDF